MDKPYRVYKRGDNETFFSNDGEGKFCCTHGGWTGTHVAPATLKHYYGEAVYDSFEDLTEAQYKQRMYKEYL